MRRQLGLVVAFGAAAGAIGAGTEARADVVAEASDARTVGTGDALVAASYGASSKTQNPAGLALMKAYVVQASYGFRPDDAKVGSVIVCDSTRRVAACLSYDYLRSSPTE